MNEKQDLVRKEMNDIKDLLRKEMNESYENLEAKIDIIINTMNHTLKDDQEKN